MPAIPPKILAIVEIVMGVLTIIAWVEHIKGIKVEKWAPEGWAKHIKSIVWPDILMVFTLFLAGLMLLKGNPLGIKLSLMAGGMLLYLLFLDASYNIQNRLYSADKGGVSLLLVDVVIGVIGVLVTYGGFTAAIV